MVQQAWAESTGSSDIGCAIGMDSTSGMEQAMEIDATEAGGKSSVMRSSLEQNRVILSCPILGCIIITISII